MKNSDSYSKILSLGAPIDLTTRAKKIGEFKENVKNVPEVSPKYRSRSTPRYLGFTSLKIFCSHSVNIFGRFTYANA